MSQKVYEAAIAKIRFLAKKKTWCTAHNTFLGVASPHVLARVNFTEGKLSAAMFESASLKCYKHIVNSLMSCEFQHRPICLNNLNNNVVTTTSKLRDRRYPALRTVLSCSQSGPPAHPGPAAQMALNSRRGAAVPRPSSAT